MQNLISLKYIRKESHIKIFKTLYVKLLLWFVGRALQGASRFDAEIQSEIASFDRKGLVFILKVYPAGPAMCIKEDNGRFKFIGSSYNEDEADVVIMLKSIDAAFLLLTFQEGTAVSSCRNRLVARGDLDLVLSLVRCLNIVEVYLLPKIIAKLALKQYPVWDFKRKHMGRIRLYFKTITGI